MSNFKNSTGQNLTDVQLLDLINSKSVASKATSEKRSFKYIIPDGTDEKKFRKELREQVQNLLIEFSQFVKQNKTVPTKEQFAKSEVFKKFADMQKNIFVKGVKFSEFYTPQKGGRNYDYYNALVQVLKKCE